MDKQRPWHVLNLDISNALRKDLDLEKMRCSAQDPAGNIGIWFFNHENLSTILTPEWIEQANNAGLPLWSALMFYRAPHFVYPEVHTDLMWAGGDSKSRAPASSAINWVLDPLDDSEMTWYNMSNDTGVLQITPANTRYLTWPLSDAEPYLFSSRTIGHIPTLVNVGIPHNIIVKNRPRWVISIRCKDDVETWDQALEFYKQWIVN